MPILLSFTNGATAARLDRTASDEEVKEVAMASLRKMFGDNIPEPEAMLFPRWLSDPWSRGGYSYPGVGSPPEDRPIMPGRSAIACSSPARRPSRSSTARCTRPCGRPSRRPRRCSAPPPASHASRDMRPWAGARAERAGTMVDRYGAEESVMILANTIFFVW